MEMLNKTHIRDEFDCGEESLTRYLKQFAMQNMRKKLSTCYVHTQEDQHVKAYYTLSNYVLLKNEIQPTTFPITVLYDRIPTTLIGKLAVDKTLQNQGVGKRVLLNALIQSYSIAMFSGSTAVVVEALNENASKFYKRFGFELLHDNKYFLPMKSIEKLLNDQTN
jgi:predicted GNAT family N-acyltransferase